MRGGGGSKPKPPMNNEVPKLPEKYAFSLSMRKKKKKPQQLKICNTGTDAKAFWCPVGGNHYLPHTPGW